DDSDEIIHNGEPIPPGYELLKHILPPEDGKPQPPEVVIVKKKAENGLYGDIVKSARMGRDQMGQAEIDFTLTADGAKKFTQTTREYAPANGQYHRMAIILDGELYSAPRIDG